MPAAIQRPAATRMRSTGFVQGWGGAGESVSLISKPTSAASGTGGSELWAVGGVVFVELNGGPQKSVANTLCPPLVPIPSPPARSRPFPSALMSPFSLTFASNLLITQGWPPGETPRMSLRTGVVHAAGAAGVQLETGITPIPPSNSTRVPAVTDGAWIITPSS